MESGGGAVRRRQSRDHCQRPQNFGGDKREPARRQNSAAIRRCRNVLSPIGCLSLKTSYRTMNSKRLTAICCAVALLLSLRARAAESPATFQVSEFTFTR